VTAVERPGVTGRVLGPGDVVLHADGLLSKWGFGDGDAPDAYLDYCEAHGRMLSSWRALLPRIIREFVLPVLDQRVEIVVVGTNHNPVRAVTVDGVNVEALWDDDSGTDLPALTPESVTVPMSAIFAMEDTG
jgi:hypothetical protein